jgi:hypothetical protein
MMNKQTNCALQRGINDQSKYGTPFLTLGVCDFFRIASSGCSFRSRLLPATGKSRSTSILLGPINIKTVQTRLDERRLN